MKNIILSFLISLLVGTVMLLGYHKFFYKKTGYVKSGIILQNYSELKTAEEQYAKEAETVKNNLDTLEARYVRLRGQFQNSSESDRKLIAYQLQTAKENYDKYNNQAGQDMESRKQQLTGEVLQKVNTFIQDYAKKNNYDLILGTTNEGSILYGNEADDLTDKIIKELSSQKTDAK